MSDEYESLYQAVGKRIRELRIQKGMTQAELAEKARLSLPVISRIETARTKIWLETFTKLAEALEVSPNDILQLDTAADTADYPREFSELLAGCSVSEVDMILKIAGQVKTTICNSKTNSDA